VARQDHLFVGWAVVTGGARRRNAHVGRLEMMVDSRVRGRGVGRALLAGVFEHAARRPQLQKLSLNVFTHNTRALALYRSFGFVEEGRREREYRFPDGSWRGDVLMSRWIGPD
jgi:ribosomal protein S18 acetylase RimI-like enzyme